MKKTVILILLGMLVLALVACGDTGTTTAPEATEAPAEGAADEVAPIDDETTETAAGEVITAPDSEEPSGEETAVSETTAVPATSADIVGTIWQWTDLVETSPASISVVPNPENYTITFNEDGTVTILADCNNVTGSYTLENGNISIVLGASTMAFCGEESLDQQYLALLSEASMAEMEGGLLYMLNADGSARMGFTAGAETESSSSLNISPNQISLDTQGLPYSWQATVVAETPYDQSQPPGPKGLPEYIEINFGVTDPADKQPGDPVMYIIPVRAYEEMWTAAGNDSVVTTINSIFNYSVSLPYPPPLSGMPVLPYEEIGGVNDLAVQVSAVPTNEASASKNGYRFVGRFMQDANPVTNQGLQYIYQGFTNDGEYLVSFFYPVSTAQLPATSADLTQEQNDAFNADPQADILAQTEYLNTLPASDWEPDLTTLDALVASLQIDGMPSSGIEHQLWELEGRSDANGDIEEIENTINYALIFNGDGTLLYQADCNTGFGQYDVTGGISGSLAIDLGASTLAECGPESLANELLGTLTTAQNYQVHPGGDILELVKPEGGGSLFFISLGPVDIIPPDVPPVEVPPPAEGETNGRVIAPTGVNVRTGPGTAYPILGVAPFGTEGEVVGRSTDNEWYAADVPSAPNGLGWVSAAYIEITNPVDLPIIQAPPPPVQPTTVPTATPPPSAQINFWADSTSLNSGQCTNLNWSVENIQAVWVYPQGANYQQFPVTGQGSQQVCPTFTTTYEMRVLRTDGVVELRQVTINVNTTNPLPNTNWALTAMYSQAPLPNSGITLSFVGNQVSGNSGCNSYSGPYSVSGNAITIGPLTQTQRACDANLMEQERVYLLALQSATNFSLSGNQLILRDAGGQALLQYSRTN